uniref:Uncharacterized protein n=1 Tax=Arundo donax TaxID=35708 RepID=A0A0A9B229_ARUDO
MEQFHHLIKNTNRIVNSENQYDMPAI